MVTVVPLGPEVGEIATLSPPGGGGTEVVLPTEVDVVVDPPWKWEMLPL